MMYSILLKKVNQVVASFYKVWINVI